MSSIYVAYSCFMLVSVMQGLHYDSGLFFVGLDLYVAKHLDCGIQRQAVVN